MRNLNPMTQILTPKQLFKLQLDRCINLQRKGWTRSDFLELLNSTKKSLADDLRDAAMGDKLAASEVGVNRSIIKAIKQILNIQ